jgi:hypothetical protein
MVPKGETWTRLLALSLISFDQCGSSVQKQSNEPSHRADLPFSEDLWKKKEKKSARPELLNKKSSSSFSVCTACLPSRPSIDLNCARASRLC